MSRGLEVVVIVVKIVGHQYYPKYTYRHFILFFGFVWSNILNFHYDNHDFLIYCLYFKILI